jgi:hypothetical protein
MRTSGRHYRYDNRDRRRDYAKSRLLRETLPIPILSINQTCGAATAGDNRHLKVAAQSGHVIKSSIE